MAEYNHGAFHVNSRGLKVSVNFLFFNEASRLKLYSYYTRRVTAHVSPVFSNFEFLELPVIGQVSSINFASIAGLQVTSQRPCWWSRTKAFLSAGKWTLFWCKFRRKISFVLTTNMAALSRGCKPRIQWCKLCISSNTVVLRPIRKIPVINSGLIQLRLQGFFSSKQAKNILTMKPYFSRNLVTLFPTIFVPEHFVPKFGRLVPKCNLLYM